MEVWLLNQKMLMVSCIWQVHPDCHASHGARRMTDETALLLTRWHDGDATALHRLLERDLEWIRRRPGERRFRARRPWRNRRR